MHDVGSDFRSGTRLIARALRIDGSADEVHVGWRDKEFKTDCTFERSADGANRCLPTTRFEGTGSYFSDAKCAARVAITNALEPCTSRFVRAAEGSCATFREHIFPAQDELLNTQTVYQRDSEQHCAPKPLKGQRVFRLGPEIAASRFVEGMSSVEGASASVAAEYLNTSDGARAFVTLRDRLHGNTPCTMFDVAGGWACEPSETSLVEQDVFSGPDCSKRVVSGCAGYFASEKVFHSATGALFWSLRGRSSAAA